MSSPLTKKLKGEQDGRTTILIYPLSHVIPSWWVTDAVSLEAPSNQGYANIAFMTASVSTRESNK